MPVAQAHAPRLASAHAALPLVHADHGIELPPRKTWHDGGGCGHGTPAPEAGMLRQCLIHGGRRRRSLGTPPCLEREGGRPDPTPATSTSSARDDARRRRGGGPPRAQPPRPRAALPTPSSVSGRRRASRLRGGRPQRAATTPGGGGSLFPAAAAFEWACGAANGLSEVGLARRSVRPLLPVDLVEARAYRPGRDSGSAAGRNFELPTFDH